MIRVKSIDTKVRSTHDFQTVRVGTFSASDTTSRLCFVAPCHIKIHEFNIVHKGTAISGNGSSTTKFIFQVAGSAVTIASRVNDSAASNDIPNGGAYAVTPGATCNTVTQGTVIELQVSCVSNNAVLTDLLATMRYSPVKHGENR